MSFGADEDPPLLPGTGVGQLRGTLLTRFGGTIPPKRRQRTGVIRALAPRAEDEQVLAVVGDAALSVGILAFEELDPCPAQFLAAVVGQ